MFAICETVGQVEWIIDDTYLVSTIVVRVLMANAFPVKICPPPFVKIHCIILPASSNHFNRDAFDIFSSNRMAFLRL